MFNATPTTDEMFGFNDMLPRDSRGRLPGDEGLHVKFYTRPVKNAIKSAEQNRDIYDDLTYVMIFVPGDDKLKIDIIATRQYFDRFPNEYKAFQSKAVVTETGTPLEAWGALAPSLIAEMKYLQIHTVEALAAMSDSNAQRFQGAHALRQKAQTWLKAAEGTAELERQQGELAKRDAEIAELRKMVEAIGATTKEKATAK